MGDPHRRLACVHIGGTNGKGSVAATIESSLRAAGLRTGLYTSPHLCSFRERIRIGGEPVSSDALLAAAERLWPALERERPSFFEATTAIAFLVLADAGVDIAIIEVGLGGRLDATNVIRPHVVGITNVERDHIELLGNTLEAIAAEKAGILKRGVPAVTGELEAAALEALARVALARAAPLERLLPEQLRALTFDLTGTRFRLDSRWWGSLELATPLIGPHQAWNVALAVEILALLPERFRPTPADLSRGVSAVRWAGRLQVERIGTTTWLFDVAHNPAGMRSLVRTAVALPLPRPLVALTAVLRDKEWQPMLAELGALADRVVLTSAPSMPSERRWDPDAAAELIDPKGAQLGVETDFACALEQVAAWAEGGTVLVTGSFHTVGDALALLGYAPDQLEPDLPLSSRAV